MGIDLHKKQYTAVIMDCFNEKLGEITFQNKPSEYGKLITKSKKYCIDEKQIVFALENSYGYGRALAVWLIEREYGDTTRDYQSERDEITRGLVRDVRHYATQLEEVEKAISEFLPRFECTLNTLPGVNDTTVAKLLSEISEDFPTLTSWRTLQE